MSYCVYLLYSKKLGKYYIGNTELTPEERLAQHNGVKNENAYTKRGIPWELYHTISCETRDQSRQIELHIKRMKSRKYLENLKRYPAIIEKLLERYKRSE